MASSFCLDTKMNPKSQVAVKLAESNQFLRSSNSYSDRYYLLNTYYQRILGYFFGSGDLVAGFSAGLVALSVDFSSLGVVIGLGVGF